MASATDVSAAYARRVANEREVLDLVRNGATLYLNGATGFPNRFMQVLMADARRFCDLRLCHPMRRNVIEFDAEPTALEMAGHIFHLSDFTYDAPVLSAIRDGRAAYRPSHSSEGARFFPYDIDVLVAAACPMDAHGCFNLGSFGGWIKDFLPRAKQVVLEVNPRQPCLFGDNWIHVDQVDAVLEADYDVVAIPQSTAAANATEVAIARNIAELIEDGATLQAGAGGIPDAVMKLLKDSGHRDLGVHTESLFDWVVTLHEAGVVTNAQKTINPGRMTAAMAIGSPALYGFVDRNPLVDIRPFSYVNDPFVIAQNRRQVSINATLQIDLSGQCASESLGPLHYSGIGGQWNFVYGAVRSEGGRAIMALPSTAAKGTISRITPMLAAGTAVSVTRNDVQHVVTEYGRVDLKGLPLDERARRLIGIAHPDFREELSRAARDELRVLPRA